MPVDAQGLDLPAKPGVYLFKRNDERVMYVGKATVLRDRIRSYFSKNPDRAMMRPDADTNERKTSETKPSHFVTNTTLPPCYNSDPWQPRIIIKNHWRSIC